MTTTMMKQPPDTRPTTVPATARAQGRAALTGCPPVGYPTVRASVAAMRAMIEAGADITGGKALQRQLAGSRLREDEASRRRVEVAREVYGSDPWAEPAEGRTVEPGHRWSSGTGELVPVAGP
ncbi:hypothetical protein [Streptomyces sp. H27-D2]|uniref:hypothetical protein n=1 Tax=Streptomyces sp. H27-D2 TaxID=3046304 RepID=UPI002DB5D58B|nr:hypothetical protein [Streptomyces sp. H27-D2]MEC4017085.1 hypothetical protein [Streptomyces sp. H27-D2]